MRPNECGKAFVASITQLVILKATQAMVLQGRLLEDQVLNLSVALAVWHFPDELQVQVRLLEFLYLPCTLHEILRGQQPLEVFVTVAEGRQSSE